jgi:hypothetical protein
MYLTVVRGCLLSTDQIRDPGIHLTRGGVPGYRIHIPLRVIESTGHLHFDRPTHPYSYIQDTLAALNAPELGDVSHTTNLQLSTFFRRIKSSGQANPKKINGWDVKVVPEPTQ